MSVGKYSQEIRPRPKGVRKAQMRKPAHIKPGTAQQVRRAAGYSRARAAAYAGVSEATLRLYEADRMAVGELSRRTLDVYFEQLENWVLEQIGRVRDGARPQ